MGMCICKDCPRKFEAYKLVDKDYLTPDELDELAQMTVRGIFGNGSVRQFKLGKWYDSVQALVNYNAWRWL